MAESDYAETIFECVKEKLGSEIRKRRQQGKVNCMLEVRVLGTDGCNENEEYKKCKDAEVLSVPVP